MASKLVIRIQELQERVSINDVLRYAGADDNRVGWLTHGWQSMRCPFHDDHTASASVNPVEGRFRCHACGVAGDIVDLMKEILGTDDTYAAVEALEQRARVGRQ